MNTAPTTYAIRVEGHLDDHWSAWLGGLDMTRDDDGATTVTVAGRRPGAASRGARRPARHRRRHLRAPHQGCTGPDLPARCSSARCTPSASPSAPPPPTTPTRPGGSAGSSPSTSGSPAAPPTSTAIASGSRSLPVSRPPSSSPSATTPRARSSATSCSGPRRQAELGWVLDPTYTGHGYATEAVRELLRHCFQDLGVRRVTASCFLDDNTSWSLMERVGMRRELHAVRESLHRSGRWLDTVGYAILEEEWSPT